MRTDVLGCGILAGFVIGILEGLLLASDVVRGIAFLFALLVALGFAMYANREIGP